MKALVVAALMVATTGPATPADEYHRAQAALAKYDDGFRLTTNAPEGPVLLRRRITAVQNWTADWLNHHPKASLADLTKAADDLDKELGVEALRLDARSVLVAAAHNEMGDAFILSDRTGRYETIWDVANHGPDKMVKGGRTLVGWAPERATSDCRSKTKDDAWGTCGPLYASIQVLPSMRTGQRRFYLDAGYAQGAGATIGKQFSIWTWDGVLARPVLVHNYEVMVDQDPARLAGNHILLSAKGELNQLFACGSCVGREMRIDIGLDTQKGAELLAVRSLTPELDVIDGLYDRVRKGKSAGTLATPGVIRRVRAELKSDASDGLPIGMIMSWKPVEGAGGHVICLSTDNDAGGHLFRFVRNKGQLKIVGISQSRSDCRGPGARH